MYYTNEASTYMGIVDVSLCPMVLRKKTNIENKLVLSKLITR